MYFELVPGFRLTIKFNIRLAINYKLGHTSNLFYFDRKISRISVLSVYDLFIALGPTNNCVVVFIVFFFFSRI